MCMLGNWLAVGVLRPVNQYDHLKEMSVCEDNVYL